MAVSNNQINFCEEVLCAEQTSKDFRFAINAHGQTPAYVATEAMPRGIRPKRHHFDKHNSASSKSSNSKSTTHDPLDDHDDQHDVGLGVLKLVWNNDVKGNRKNCLFVPDFHRQTCLHLAAAQGRNDIIKFED